MRKIISMLLAVSMSLSVMCSSFTVTAVDGNNTAAQTESTVQSSSTGFDGLFGNAINEKIAEKSNNYGINSVEVSGNTATVSYWSSKDCTVIVGIYEDDGTNGTHTGAKGQTASTSFTITVVDDKREVESIKIKTLPNKTEYAIGEALDITGLTVDVNFTDGSSDTGVKVSSGWVSGFDSETAGTKVLTVTYTDKYDNEATASFYVEVVSDGDVKSIQIYQLFDKNKYCEINKELNLDGATIHVTYKNGETKIISITSDMVEDFDSSTLGTFPVTVTYEQCRTTYDVEVVENLKKVCRIEFDTTNKNFNAWQGDRATHVRGRVPEGAGAGGEVGLCRRQHHADALQGQSAIPSA